MQVTPFTEPAKLEAECGTAALVITQVTCGAYMVHLAHSTGKGEAGGMAVIITFDFITSGTASCSTLHCPHSCAYRP